MDDPFKKVQKIIQKYCWVSKESNFKVVEKFWMHWNSENLESYSENYLKGSEKSPEESPQKFSECCGTKN